MFKRKSTTELTMVKRKRTTELTMVKGKKTTTEQTLHRKLKIAQHEPP